MWRSRPRRLGPNATPAKPHAPCIAHATIYKITDHRFDQPPRPFLRILPHVTLLPLFVAMAGFAAKAIFLVGLPFIAVALFAGFAPPFDGYTCLLLGVISVYSPHLCRNLVVGTTFGYDNREPRENVNSKRAVKADKDVLRLVRTLGAAHQNGFEALLVFAKVVFRRAAKEFLAAAAALAEHPDRVQRLFLNHKYT